MSVEDDASNELKNTPTLKYKFNTKYELETGQKISRSRFLLNRTSGIYNPDLLRTIHRKLTLFENSSKFVDNESNRFINLNAPNSNQNNLNYPNNYIYNSNNPNHHVNTIGSSLKLDNQISKIRDDSVDLNFDEEDESLLLAPFPISCKERVPTPRSALIDSSFRDSSEMVLHTDLQNNIQTNLKNTSQTSIQTNMQNTSQTNIQTNIKNTTENEKSNHGTSPEIS